MNKKKMAVIYMLLAALGYTLMGVGIKWLPRIPLFEKIFARTFMTLCFSLFLGLRKGERFNIAKENRSDLSTRAFVGYFSVITNVYAISHLILADSTMLSRLTPVTVSICAVFILKEKIDSTQIWGVILSFIGALFVIKPTFSLAVIPSLSGLISVSFAGISNCYIRLLKDREGPNVIVFYFSLLSVLGSFPFMITNFVTPTLTETFILIFVGLMASFGQICLTYAYINSKASEVAIYNNVGIIYGIILGYLLFNEMPDLYSIIGGAIIIVVAIYIYNYNNHNNYKEAD